MLSCKQIHTRKIYVLEEGDGTNCTVVNQLQSWLFYDPRGNRASSVRDGGENGGRRVEVDSAQPRIEMVTKRIEYQLFENG